MSDSGLQCHGCGSTHVTFDPQKRMLICNQCGKEEYYSRATLNANGKVVYSKQNAIDFFSKGNYDLASRFAHDVINISLDNVPALYILAYYDDFVLGKAGAVNAFFKRMGKAALEYDEITELMTLFLASPYKLIEYEKDVIQIVAANLQSEEDIPVLQDFIDKLCPYLISKRPSMSFLTQDMAAMYCELAEHCNIPKTCFALLKAIQTNPDSPYTNDTFFLKPKLRYFYDHFIIPVGSIIAAMKENPVKDKFVNAYAQTKQKFEADASLQQ